MAELFNTLDKFGHRALGDAIDLLQAYRTRAKPDNWDDNGVMIDFSDHSGCVYLTNEHCQVLFLHSKYGLCLNHILPVKDYDGALPDVCKDYLDNPAILEAIEDRNYVVKAIDCERVFFSNHENSGDILQVLDKAYQQILLDVARSNVNQVIEAVKHEHPDFKIRLDDGDWLDNVYQSQGIGLFAGMDTDFELVAIGAMKDWFFEALKKANESDKYPLC